MPFISNIADRFRAEFVARIVTALSGGLLVVALGRLLGPDGYGLLYLAISVFGIADFFSRLGITKSAAKYIAEYKETDTSQIRHIIRFSFILNGISITITSVLLYFMSEIIAEFFSEPELAPFLLLGVLYVVFGNLVNYVRRILQGFESIKSSAILQIHKSITRVAFGLGLVLFGYGALGALIGYTLSFSLVALGGLFYLYAKYYRNLPVGRQEKGLRRRIIKYTLPLTVTGSANLLQNRIDTLLVGFFVGPIGVAYYTISEQVVQFIETPMSALGFTISPTYEVLVQKGDRNRAARLYENALTHGLLLYIPATFGLIIIAEPMIDVILNTDYSGASPVLQVMAIWATFQSVSKITSNGLDYLGRAKDRAILTVIVSIVNITLNLILIPTVGVVGAAVATVIATGIYALGCMYFISTELQLRTLWLTRYISVIILISLIMSGPVYILADYITGFVSLFFVVITGGVIWFVLSMITGFITMEKVKLLL